MALVGYEIIQSRTWVDPHAQTAPKLNHKNVFPITVFDAVRSDMQDENSITLKQTIDNINNKLINTQSILPAKPANYIVTYGGAAGQVSSIPITTSISDNYSDNKIPTEKAVGSYISDILSESSVKWDDINQSIKLINEKLDNLSNTTITQNNPVINNRPDINASDKNNNGNLIPDVQWVINKIEELIVNHEEEFMEKLKTILPCLQPKPPKTDQVVEGLSSANIEGIVDGTVEPDPSERINIGGYTMERIPDAIVEGIANATTNPDPASRIVVDDIWIEAIDKNTILGIMDGTITPTSSQIVIPAEIIESNCNCPCCN